MVSCPVQLSSAPICVAQCTSAVTPLVERVRADWLAKRRDAERAAQAEGWGGRDDLLETSEMLHSIFENYSNPDHDDGGSSGDDDD